jgi:hypothetical protein
MFIFDEQKIREVMKERERWEKTMVADWLCRMPERQRSVASKLDVEVVFV